MIKQKRNKSYTALLNAAKPLFWKYGIQKVTVEDIYTNAGVSKMTFYRNFKNKQEVVKQLLLDMVEKGWSTYRDIMNKDITYPEKIKLIMEEKYHNAEGLSQEMLADIHKPESKEIQAVLAVHTQRSMTQFMADLRQAQKEGWIRQDINLSFVMYILGDLQNKLFDEHLTPLYKQPSDLIKEITNFFFYGIIDQEK